MADLRVALVQMRSDLADRPATLARACAAIDAACREAAAAPDLVVLPELFNTGYFPQYRDWSYLEAAEPADGPTLAALRERARRWRVAIVAPIFEVAAPGHYYDSAFLLGPDGETLCVYRKTHPAAMESLEKIYFRPGSRFPVVGLPNGWKVGLIICYDAYFPEAARSVALHGADLLVIPFAGGTMHHWYDLLSVRAFENLLYLAACNKVGVEGEQPFGGRSCVYGPLGEQLATASPDREETVAVTLDARAVWSARRRYTMYRDRRPDLYGALVRQPEDLDPPGTGA
jgi:predicted amidohydrolase